MINTQTTGKNSCRAEVTRSSGGMFEGPEGDESWLPGEGDLKDRLEGVGNEAPALKRALRRWGEGRVMWGAGQCWAVPRKDLVEFRWQGTARTGREKDWKSR